MTTNLCRRDLRRPPSLRTLDQQRLGCVIDLVGGLSSSHLVSSPFCSLSLLYLVHDHRYYFEVRRNSDPGSHDSRLCSLFLTCVRIERSLQSFLHSSTRVELRLPIYDIRRQYLHRTNHCKHHVPGTTAVRTNHTTPVLVPILCQV